MTDSVVIQILVLLVLIVCSALLTGAEAAYFSLGRARLTRLATERRQGGQAPRLIDRPHDLLVTLLVGITLINVGGSALAAHVANQVVGSRFGPLPNPVAFWCDPLILEFVFGMLIAVVFRDGFRLPTGSRIRRVSARAKPPPKRLRSRKVDEAEPPWVRSGRSCGPR